MFHSYLSMANAILCIGLPPVPDLRYRQVWPSESATSCRTFLEFFLAGFANKTSGVIASPYEPLFRCSKAASLTSVMPFAFHVRLWKRCNESYTFCRTFSFPSLTTFKASSLPPGQSISRVNVGGRIWPFRFILTIPWIGYNRQPIGRTS